MSFSVFALVLVAAAVHAGWNALIKGADDKMLSTGLVTVMAAGLAAGGLPFVPLPETALWPYILGSTLLQILYYALVAGAYRRADFSQAYPLMRGTAPLVVALVAHFGLGQPLPGWAWAGVGLLCGGIIATAGGRRGGPGTGMALLNAFVIAGYTLVDGMAVRRTGSPLAYTLWIFLLTGAALGTWTLARYRRRAVDYARRHWALGLSGGAGTLIAYGIAVWAMGQAPIALVAALRETSIVFAAGLAVLLFGERLPRARWLALGAILGGVAVLRLT